MYPSPPPNYQLQLLFPKDLAIESKFSKSLGLTPVYNQGGFNGITLPNELLSNILPDLNEIQDQLNALYDAQKRTFSHWLDTTYGLEHYAEVAIENKKVTMLYYPEEQEKKDKLFADFSKFFGPKGPLNLNGHPTFKPTKKFFYALHTKFDTFLKSQGDAATPPPNYGNLNISRDHLEKFIKLMKDEDDVGWFIDYAAQAFSNAITIYLNNHSSELSTDERNTFESAKAMLVGQTDGKKAEA